ncbi:uncharacterized protein LOC135936100 [Cloeon dipterum]|uniref:uncharacterized protein LOC135936100 n=1 Tax=Cloeon dipterum TaxID=197152 RepID=UPI00321FDECD
MTDSAIAKEESISPSRLRSEIDARHFTMHARLPEFNSKDPGTWFVLLENDFGMNKVLDDGVRYSHLISLLGSRISNFMAVVRAPPPTNKYEFLKQQVLQRCAVSKEQQFKDFVSKMEGSNRLPSRLLHRLRREAVNHEVSQSDAFLKCLWLEKLPEFVWKTVEPHKRSMKLDQLATLADSIYESKGQREVVTPKSKVASDFLLKDIVRRLEFLEECQRQRDKSARADERKKARD